MNMNDDFRHITSRIELINLQATALFTHDAQGRLRHVREPGYAEAELYPAPRFFMGRTAQGNIWRFRYDLPLELVEQLEELCRHEPITSDFAELPKQAAPIHAVLNKQQPVTTEVRGPAYWIPDGLSLAGDTVLISEANKTLLEAHFSWAITSPSNFRVGPIVAAVVDETAVSICHCARITADVAEAGVETVEGYRGRGLAGTAVSHWATIMREQGRIPLYSTSWDNTSSQSVARKLNMVCYGEDWSIT